MSNVMLTSDEITFVKAMFAAVKGQPVTGGSSEVEADIDGPFGDPQVRKDPRYVNGKEYTGPSFVGCRYSACPSEYLRAVAKLLEFVAGKEKAEPNPWKSEKTGKFGWEYKLEDAKRALAWAKRNEGKTFSNPSAPRNEDETTDLLF